MRIRDLIAIKVFFWVKHDWTLKTFSMKLEKFKKTFPSFIDFSLIFSAKYPFYSNYMLILVLEGIYLLIFGNLCDKKNFIALLSFRVSNTWGLSLFSSKCLQSTEIFVFENWKVICYFKHFNWSIKIYWMHEKISISNWDTIFLEENLERKREKFFTAKSNK